MQVTYMQVTYMQKSVICKSRLYANILEFPNQTLTKSFFLIRSYANRLYVKVGYIHKNNLEIWR